VAAAALFVPTDAPTAGDYPHQMLPANHQAAAPITDQPMARWLPEINETHPITRPAAAAGTPVALFRAFSSDYDLDSNPSGTPVDTAYIMVGETVGWQRLIGIHTLTSGESSVDPQVGMLFDVPLDAGSPTFEHTYTQAGTFPFFCRPHEDLNMRGVVVVEGAVDVTPLPGYGSALGFTRSPYPNPTLGEISFRFALRETGLARALVLDASGRRVAQIVDDRLAAGTYGARWNGLDEAGNKVRAGIYYVHLILPGYQSAKQVVLTR
jgi:plastocyanin